MLTFNVILGYKGLQFQDFLRLFCLLGFFFQSDRPTQYQETHSTLNEKQRGWPYVASYFYLTGFTSLIKPLIFGNYGLKQEKTIVIKNNAIFRARVLNVDIVQRQLVKFLPLSKSYFQSYIQTSLLSMALSTFYCLYMNQIIMNISTQAMSVFTVK